MFPFENGGMTARRYAEFYEEVHSVVCKKGKTMKKAKAPEPGAIPEKILPPEKDYIKEVFGAGGHLSKGIKNYQERPSQIAIARAIEKGIREKRHVIAEGPTGTGKSLAYCVPAAYYAQAAGLRCIIVTSNKTLQEQIYSKDLGDLRKATGWNFTYAIRKGIGSYLCERDYLEGNYRKLLGEVNQAQAAGKVQKKETPLEDLSERMIHSTVEWADNTTNGDREVIEGLAPNNRVWSYFSAGRDDCDGRQCPEYGSCHMAKAKALAEDANIVITNYWLFFMHVRNSDDQGVSNIFGKFDLVIFDESHNAADIARGFWGLEVGKWSIRRAISGLRSEVGGMVRNDKNEWVREDGEDIWDRCWSATDVAWEQIDEIAKTGDIRLRTKGQLKTEELESSLLAAAGFFYGAAKRIEPDDEEDKTPEAQKARKEASKVRRKGKRCEELQIKMESFRDLPLLNADRWKRQVYYIENEKDDGDRMMAKLTSKSLFVGSELHNRLFRRYPTVVLTSATLATSSGASKFRHIKTEIGLDGLKPIELTVESPFRWRDRCLLIVLDEETIPSLAKNDDRDAAWKEALPGVMEKIVRMTKGRAMLLFTANERKRIVGEHLTNAKLPFKVLTEKLASPGELQKMFREDTSSILLGSKRFSEGVDVQGESCSCVIIDRIPFRIPGDPLIAAISELLAKENGLSLSEGGIKAFNDYCVPEGIISFKQRMGRLLRTTGDGGIVVVTDDKLLKKNYRHRFYQAIPHVRRSTSLADGKAFMEKLGLL